MGAPRARGVHAAHLGCAAGKASGKIARAELQGAWPEPQKTEQEQRSENQGPAQSKSRDVIKPRAEGEPYFLGVNLGLQQHRDRKIVQRENEAQGE